MFFVKVTDPQLPASSRPAWLLLNPLVYAGTKLAMMGRGKKNGCINTINLRHWFKAKGLILENRSAK